MHFERAPDTGAVEADDGTVYAARLPDGPILVLTGTAARVWHAAAGTGSAAAGIGADELASALDDRGAVDPVPFAEALVDAGLLITREDS